MCFFGGGNSQPAAPAPIPEKQAQRSPSLDPSGRAQQDLQRRMGLAATILTPAMMGAASTTNINSTPGKTTLGA